MHSYITIGRPGEGPKNSVIRFEGDQALHNLLLNGNFDTDGNGTVTADEFKNAILNTGAKFTTGDDNELKQIFGDGIKVAGDFKSISKYFQDRENRHVAGMVDE